MRRLIQAARLGLRHFLAEARRGQLRTVVLAAALASAAVSAVAMLTDRVERAMAQQATELLGADLRLSGPTEPPPAWIQQARALGLETARVTRFPSVITPGERPRLVRVKAVDGAYPLRGRLVIDDGTERSRARGPGPGTAWGAGRMFDAWGLEPGRTLGLGSAELELTARLVREPDVAGALFRPAPTLMINAGDLAATGLVTPASRVTHALLVAGEAAAVAEFRAWVEPRLEANQSLRGGDDVGPEMRSAIDRADRFLGMAAAVAVLVAFAAIALATQAYRGRALDGAALMRSLGASGAAMRAYLYAGLAALALLGGLLGALAGVLAQAGLGALLGDFLALELPATSPLTAGVGVVVAGLGILGFALPQLAGVAAVPPMRVFRGGLSGRPLRRAIGWLPGLGAGLALILHQAGDWTLGLGFAGGLLVGGGLVALLTRLLLGLGRGGLSGGAGWRLGLANLFRRPGMAALQVTAFTLGIAALLLLGQVRGALMEAWEAQVPADAPNQFLINIQPGQETAVAAFLRGEGLEPAGVYPMIRARLEAIGERPVGKIAFATDRGQRFATRTFNLTESAALQAGNAVVEGAWWSPGDHGRPLMSVEADFAESLGIGIGDRLRFDVAGRELVAEVDNLRSVAWDSFRPNFFVVFPPGVLDGLPRQYVTSFHLPEDRGAVLGRLVDRFPALTVIDIESLIGEVRRVIERASLAVRYVFLFSLAAAVLVFHAAFRATLAERIRDAAVIRALGGRRRQIQWAFVTEFGLVGLLAGGFASLAALAIGHWLAAAVFELELALSGWVWLGVPPLVAGLFALAGVAAARTVLRRSPILLMRAA